MGSWSPNHIFHPCKILLERTKDHKCYTIFYFHFKHNALDEFWGKVVTENFLTNKFNKAIFLRYFSLPSFCHYKVNLLPYFAPQSFLEKALKHAVIKINSLLSWQVFYTYTLCFYATSCLSHYIYSSLKVIQVCWSNVLPEAATSIPILIFPV